VHAQNAATSGNQQSQNTGEAQANYQPPKNLNTASNVPAGSASQNLYPQLYVAGVETNTDTYKAGETATGTFVLANSSPTPVLKAYYRISLGQYSEEQMPPDRAFETKTGGPVFVNADSQKRVTFSYKVPHAASGTDYGIEIQSQLASGIEKGRGNTAIDVTGGKGGGCAAIKRRACKQRK